MATASKKAALQGMFEDKENCFGKMYDGEEAECTKCLDNKPCQDWQAAKGDPEATNTEKEETAVSKGNSKKPAPAKKEDTKKPTPAAPAKKSAPAAPDKSAPAKKDEAAVPAKKEEVKKSAPKVEKDANGFKVGSTSGTVYSMLLEAKHTKADIEKATGSEGKSTVTLILSDLQKPVGTYSISRGIKIVASDKGALSIEGAEKPAKKK